MDKIPAEARDDVTLPFAGYGIIRFGIVCCAVTMVIVLAVAVAAS